MVRALVFRTVIVTVFIHRFAAFFNMIGHFGAAFSPLPVSDFRQVLAVLVDVFLVLDQLVF